MKAARRVALAGLAAAALAATGGGADAHHSGAMFDGAKTVSIDGTVQTFQFTNPHSWLNVVVVDAAGNQAIWAFEAEGPSTLLRSGIRKSTFMPGDKVTVKCHPMRDGRPAGSMLSVRKADGTVFSPHLDPVTPPANPS